jgi:hypothetical protein
MRKTRDRKLATLLLLDEPTTICPRCGEKRKVLNSGLYIPESPNCKRLYFQCTKCNIRGYRLLNAELELDRCYVTSDVECFSSDEEKKTEVNDDT